MKFIIDTGDLESSASMIEMILANEFAYPIEVKKISKDSISIDEFLN